MAEFNTIDVLTRSGIERERFLALAGESASDEELVEGLVLTSGRRAIAEERTVELAALCATLRIMDAYRSDQIGEDEFARGFTSLFRQAGGFHGCGRVRRPLRRLLDATSQCDPMLKARVIEVWAAGRAYFAKATTGRKNPVKPKNRGFDTGSGDPHDVYSSHRIKDSARVARLNTLAAELIGESPGLVNVEHIPEVAASRGWVALLAESDRFGDDEDEAVRLIQYLRENGVTSLIHINSESGGYSISGVVLHCNGPHPDTYEFRLTDEDLEIALMGNWWYGLYTTEDGRFLYVESDEFHVLAGPRELVEAARGKSFEDAAAEFVEYVEGHRDVDWMNELLARLAGVFGHR